MLLQKGTKVVYMSTHMHARTHGHRHTHTAYLSGLYFLLLWAVLWRHNSLHTLGLRLGRRLADHTPFLGLTEEGNKGRGTPATVAAAWAIFLELIKS